MQHLLTFTSSFEEKLHLWEAVLQESVHLFIELGDGGQSVGDVGECGGGRRRVVVAESGSWGRRRRRRRRRKARREGERGTSMARRKHYRISGYSCHSKFVRFSLKLHVINSYDNKFMRYVAGYGH